MRREMTSSLVLRRWSNRHLNVRYGTMCSFSEINRALK